MSDATGLCGCGCGQPTRLAEQTRTARGWVKGQPKRFVQGHRLLKDDAAYSTVHGWLINNHPKTGVCDECGQSAHTEHALIHGLAHSHNRESYRELCPRCHRHYDFPCHSPRARLTEDDVRAIRRRWAAGETQVALGREYGVTNHAIWRIVHHLNWTWVQ